MLMLAELDHILIFFACFLSIILIFRRTLNVWFAFGALACACVFILLDGHFYLAELTLAPEQNPQIATVVLFCATTALLAGASMRPKWRSLDRLIIAFASCSVLITGVVFHSVLIQTILPAWAKDTAWGNSFLISIPREQFLETCAETTLQCWSSPLDFESINKAFRQQVESVHRFYEANKPEHEVGFGFGAFNDLEQDGVAVVLYHRAGDDVRVIADPAGGQRVHSAIRDGFYFLSAIAHSVWIFGALWLIGFHSRRFRKRAAHVG